MARRSVPLTESQLAEVEDYKASIRSEWSRIALDDWNAGTIRDMRDIREAFYALGTRPELSDTLFKSIKLPNGLRLDCGDVAEIAYVAYCTALFPDMGDDFAAMAVSSLWLSVKKGWITLNQRAK